MPGTKSFISYKIQIIMELKMVQSMKEEEMPKKLRTYGFRFSVTDFFVLLIAAWSNWFLWGYLEEISLLIAFVVFHFFLFCNVFRIRQKFELIWSAVFLSNFFIWLHFLDANVVGLFATTFIFTIIIIVREFYQPRYHGIFAKKINKSLDLYLKNKI